MALGSNPTPMNNAAQDKTSTGHLNLSTPAGWTTLYFFASVVILGILLLNV